LADQWDKRKIKWMVLLNEFYVLNKYLKCE